MYIDSYTNYKADTCMYIIWLDINMNIIKLKQPKSGWLHSTHFMGESKGIISIKKLKTQKMFKLIP